jgi:hypothetical protein
MPSRSRTTGPALLDRRRRSLLAFTAERAGSIGLCDIVSPNPLPPSNGCSGWSTRAGIASSEPALELTDLMRTDLNGRGVINIWRPISLFCNHTSTPVSSLAALSFEAAGLATWKPRLVFVFDRPSAIRCPACPPSAGQQVVRIIRSKGSASTSAQFPDDVPNDILGQLQPHSAPCGPIRRDRRPSGWRLLSQSEADVARSSVSSASVRR